MSEGTSTGNISLAEVEKSKDAVKEEFVTRSIKLFSTVFNFLMLFETIFYNTFSCSFFLFLVQVQYFYFRFIFQPQNFRNSYSHVLHVFVCLSCIKLLSCCLVLSYCLVVLYLVIVCSMANSYRRRNKTKQKKIELIITDDNVF